MSEKKTNFDMVTESPEELAKLISSTYCPEGRNCIDNCIGDCKQCWLNWLKLEAGK